MGKIVKFCGKCEEGFAAKFGFCPNCGEHLEAFEMNPVAEAATTDVFLTNNLADEAPLQNSFETLPKVEEPIVAATAAFSDDDILELDSVDVPQEIVEEQETFIRPSAASESAYQYQFTPVAEPTQAYSYNAKTQADDGFHVTVIEEKDVQLRNGLLLGFGTLVVMTAMIGWVMALFAASLPVFALDEPALFSFVGPIEDIPMNEDEPPKKNDDEGGGGGGGGQENPNQATKGRLPNQVENPLNPLLSVTQMSNPTFVVRNETKGDNKREQTDEVTGLPDGVVSDNLSGGPGKGGGFGKGDGRGAGNGKGLGEGDGDGSGSGDGDGDGNGDGTGDGDRNNREPTLTEKPKPVGVTVGLKILSKPQAKYTDAGRQNNVQGTVTLKVTFTSSGTIGGVSTISGLPYGLTEQAIAAAKQMRFEPAKKNGAAISVTKTVAYSFTIY